MSGDTSERYYCDCPVYCKHRKRVERSTWFEHAKYRNTLRSFDEHAAGLGLLMDGDLRGTTAVSEGPPVKRRCLDSPARSQSSVSSNGSTGYATMQMSDDPPPLQVADSDGFGEMLPEEDDIPDPGSVADPIPEEDTDDEDEDPDADPPASEPPTPPLDPSNTPHAPPEVIPPPNLLPAANGKLSMADAQSQRGSKRLVEDDENVTLWFIEDEKTGKPVSGARAKAMRSQARKIWTYLKGLGKLATQWGNVDSVARSYYAGEMRRFFPELRLCDLDYKADRIAVLSYPGWYSTGSSKVKLEEDTHEDLCVDDASAVVTGEKRAASAAPDNEPAAKKAATAQAKPQKKKKARSSTMAPPALPPSPSAAAAPPPPPSSTSRSPPSTTAPQSVLPMLPSAEPAPPPFTLPSEQPLQPHPPLPLPSALSFTPTASSPVAPAPSSASSAYLPPITNSPLPVALPHQAIASSSTAPAPGPVIPLTVDDPLAFLGPPSGPTTRAEFVEEKARKGKSVKGKKKATTAAAAQDQPDGLVEEAPKASRVKYLRGSATNNTARNLCLLAYRAKHGKAPEDEFNAYFTTLTPEQMKIWDDMSAMKEAAKKSLG